MNDSSADPGPWTDAPPPSLTARLAEVLGGDSLESRDVGELSNVYLEAAEGLLSSLLTEGGATRDRAIDLLTVDSLVTYAFEAAAREPNTVADRAQAAMLRIARLAEPK